ncbi:ring finger protein-like [Discoglossus pictus]
MICGRSDQPLGEEHEIRRPGGAWASTSFGSPGTSRLGLGQSMGVLQPKISTYCTGPHLARSRTREFGGFVEGGTGEDLGRDSPERPSLRLDRHSENPKEITVRRNDGERSTKNSQLEPLSTGHDEEMRPLNMEEVTNLGELEMGSSGFYRTQDEISTGLWGQAEEEHDEQPDLESKVHLLVEEQTIEQECLVSTKLLESKVHLLVEEQTIEQECPICTELYDAGPHKQSLLNCNHKFCDNCIKTIMDKAGQADIGRVKCPICRQKTPILKWEIQKLQDQMLENGVRQVQEVHITMTQPVRRPGLWGGLEFRFQQRFQTRMCPFPPCLRYPVCLINGLRALERRCRCLYLAMLVILAGVESMCFLLLLLPILVLVLFILFVN